DAPLRDSGRGNRRGRATDRAGRRPPAHAGGGRGDRGDRRAHGLSRWGAPLHRCRPAVPQSALAGPAAARGAGHAHCEAAGEMPAGGGSPVDDLRRIPHRVGACRIPGVCLLGGFGCFLIAMNAWGYRPFISTDAAVADPHEMEIELGYFTLERGAGEHTFTLPHPVPNYRLWRDLEVVGDLAAARDTAGELNLVDPGLSVKAVLKEGVLQEKEGLSVAVEAGPLLPSTRPGERSVGFEAIGIVSGRVAPFTLHVNGGGGANR